MKEETIHKQERNKRQHILSRMAIAVIAVHIISIAAVVVLFVTVPQDKASSVMTEIIEKLEKGGSSGETIRDIKRIHPLLYIAEKNESSNDYREIMVYVIIVLLVQGVLLLLTLFPDFLNRTETLDMADRSSEVQKEGSNLNSGDKPSHT